MREKGNKLFPHLLPLALGEGTSFLPAFAPWVGCPRPGGERESQGPSPAGQSIPLCSAPGLHTSLLTFSPYLLPAVMTLCPPSPTFSAACWVSSASANVLQLFPFPPEAAAASSHCCLRELQGKKASWGNQ